MKSSLKYNLQVLNISLYRYSTHRMWRKKEREREDEKKVSLNVKCWQKLNERVMANNFTYIQFEMSLVKFISEVEQKKQSQFHMNYKKNTCQQFQPNEIYEKIIITIEQKNQLKQIEKQFLMHIISLKTVFT